MSKRRDESDGRPGDRKGGFGRPESTNKFYSKFDKDADRRGGDNRFERRERSYDKPGHDRPDHDKPGYDKPRYDKPGFDKPRGARPSEGGRRFENERSDRPRRDDQNRPDRPRFGQSDDRRSFNRDENRGRNDRFREDSPRGGRYEGGAPRRNFDETRPNRRDDDRPFRREDRPDNREGRSFDRPDNRSSRFEGGGPRREFRRDDERPDRNGPRSNRFNNSESRDDKPRYGRSGEAGGRNNDRFGSEKSYGDRSRYSEPRSDRPERRDDRFGNERGYGERGGREDSFRSRREDRPDNRERRSFDRDRREERPGRFDRPERAEDDGFRQKVEASRERQVGRSREPEYNLDKLRERAFGGRNPRDKKGAKKPGRSQADRSEREPREPEDGMIRLNRYIANAGICSRRDADALIAQGDISVNGKVITEMGYRVKPTDVVKYGTRVLNPEKMTYVLLNKPKDYITTTDDPNDRNTVMDLVAGATPYRIYPVGRLDRNTTGLLLLTNDGELVEKLTHPSNEIKKVYQVELDKPITTEHFEAIRDGIELEDGLIKPDDLGIVTPDAQVIGIEIHSGRNRIVRRIFEHFGYEVTKLDRTVYAGLTKKELPRGTWRYLDEKEVIRLKFLL